MVQTLVENRIEVLIQTIRSRFPDAVVEFSTRDFSGHTELWVYITNIGEYSRIEEFCRSLEQQEEGREPPIWIFAKAWTGPWPGGESEQEIKRRRDEFKRKHNITVGTAP